MICPPCRAGGARAKASRRTGILPADPILLAQARASHKNCEAPETCPCKHSVDNPLAQPKGTNR